jgi:hypothetical protein
VEGWGWIFLVTTQLLSLHNRLCHTQPVHSFCAPLLSRLLDALPPLLPLLLLHDATFSPSLFFKRHHNRLQRGGTLLGLQEAEPALQGDALAAVLVVGAKAGGVSAKGGLTLTVNLG